LLTSLSTYLNHPAQKLLDLGPGWRREVGRRLPPDLEQNLSVLWTGKAAKQADPQTVAEARALRSLLHLLVWSSPADLSAPDFISWASCVPVERLLELVAEAFGAGVQVPANVAFLRDQAVDLLSGWHEAYFDSVDAAILAGLSEDAAAKAAMVDRMPPEELVEKASCGVVVEATPGINSVVLIPQYHSRPWNLLSDLGDHLFLNYPAEAWPARPDEPSTRLTRLTRALGDENRLRLLAFLAGDTRTFGAIAGHLGLAKSTIHHHMVVLRAAGLVRVFTKYGQYLGDRYALRREALIELSDELKHFVGTEGSR
jgi:DNA-binding transcriptional ArsR family regulator